MTTSAIDDLGLAALALLRTAAWMYGLLLVVAAATTPLDAPGVAAGLLLPLSPLAFTAVAQSMLAERGRELRVVPFAVAAFAAGAALLGTWIAMVPGGLGDLVIAATGVAVGAAAISAFSDPPTATSSEQTSAR